MRLALVLLATVAALTLAAPANAAWTKAGTCKVPANQRAQFPNVKPETRLKTRRVPCFQAAYSVEDAARRGLLKPNRRARFEFRSFGARWVHDWTCRRTKRKAHFSFSCRDEEGGRMSFRRPRR